MSEIRWVDKKRRAVFLLSAERSITAICPVSGIVITTGAPRERSSINFPWEIRGWNIFLCREWGYALVMTLLKRAIWFPLGSVRIAPYWATVVSNSSSRHVFKTLKRPCGFPLLCLFPNVRIVKYGSTRAGEIENTQGARLGLSLWHFEGVRVEG